MHVSFVFLGVPAFLTYLVMATVVMLLFLLHPVADPCTLLLLLLLLLLPVHPAALVHVSLP